MPQRLITSQGEPMRDQASPALHHNEGVLRQSRVKRELPDRASILRLRFARRSSARFRSAARTRRRRTASRTSCRTAPEPPHPPDLFTCPSTTTSVSQPRCTVTSGSTPSARQDGATDAEMSTLRSTRSTPAVDADGPNLGRPPSRFRQSRAAFAPTTSPACARRPAGPYITSCSRVGSTT